jgi:hypothetical protein
MHDLGHLFSPESAFHVLGATDHSSRPIWDDNITPSQPTRLGAFLWHSTLNLRV